jgi:hypothetical protein
MVCQTMSALCFLIGVSGARLVCPEHDDSRDTAMLCKGPGRRQSEVDIRRSSMWTMSTSECDSSTALKGCGSGIAPEGGAGVRAGPVGGICGLAERSEGDLSVADPGVEYRHRRSTVVQFMQCGRVSSHCTVSRPGQQYVDMDAYFNCFRVSHDYRGLGERLGRLTVTFLAFETPVPGLPMASAHHLPGSGRAVDIAVALLSADGSPQRFWEKSGN